jgi:hypothetical protein
MPSENNSIAAMNVKQTHENTFEVEKHVVTHATSNMRLCNELLTIAPHPLIAIIETIEKLNQ